MYFKKYLLGPQKPPSCPSPVAALLFSKDNHNPAFFVFMILNFILKENYAASLSDLLLLFNIIYVIFHPCYM